MTTKRTKMVVSGDTFELIVGEYLKSIYDCEIIYNAEFFCPRIFKGTECDVICITPQKIYCIECKNYSSAICGTDYSLEWVFYSRGKRNSVANPVLGNMRHVRAIRGLFRKNGLVPPSIENIVCVPDTCKIHTTCKEVITIGALISKVHLDSFDSVKYNLKSMTAQIDLLSN